MIKINTKNIPHLHNYDLYSKLVCATHPKVNDIEGAKLVRDEIEKRKIEGSWTTCYENSDNVMTKNQ